MRTISFITQKGGSGKTTLATCLAVAAAEAGETVALLDLDPQGMATRWGKKREAAQAKAEAAGKADLAARLEKPHVQAFPASRIAELPKVVAALAESFSVVILDTQGADTAATHIAMKASSLCIVPMRPTSADAEMAMPTINAMRASTTPWSFVLTQCSTIPNNSRAAEMVEGMRRYGLLAEPLIYLRSAYQDAYTYGVGVTELETKGKAAVEIRELWQTLNAMTKEKK